MRDPLSLKNFRRLKAAIDTRPFLTEVNAMESLWLVNTSRQSQISVQRETNTIFLRAADHTNSQEQNVNNIQESVTTRHAACCPNIMRFLEIFSEERQASLQRVLIARLKPQGRVYPHVDKGRYYKLRDRYHFVLVSPTGSVLSSGGETVIMQQGEVWWLQNKLVREARNSSHEWRCVAILDHDHTQYP